MSRLHRTGRGGKDIPRAIDSGNPPAIANDFKTSIVKELGNTPDGEPYADHLSVPAQEYLQVQLLSREDSVRLAFNAGWRSAVHALRRYIEAEGGTQ